MIVLLRCTDLKELPERNLEPLREDNNCEFVSSVTSLIRHKSKQSFEMAAS